MRKDYITNVLRVIIIFFIVVSLDPVQGQQSMEMSNGTNPHFNVKIGDTKEYKVTKIDYGYPRMGIKLNNGSIIDVKLSIGMRSYYTVINISNENGIEQAYVNYSVNIPGEGNITSATTQYHGDGYGHFLNPAYSDEFELKAVLTQVYGENFVEGTNYTINGDLVTLIKNLSLTTDTWSTDLTINWKIGWAEKYDRKVIYKNGTMIELIIEIVKNNKQSTTALTELMPLTVSSLLVFVSYRRFKSRKT